MRVANVRAVRIAPPLDTTLLRLAALKTVVLNEPKRIATLSDANPPAYEWLVDSRLGSPAHGVDASVEKMHEFSVNTTKVGGSSICVLGKSIERRKRELE